MALFDSSAAASPSENACATGPISNVALQERSELICSRRQSSVPSPL